MILQVGDGSQMSDADTDRVTGTRRWSGGHKLPGLAVTLLIVGGVVSTIVTVCWAVDVFLDASVAVQVTFVIPRGKSPGALFPNVGAASQTSSAVALIVTLVPFGPSHSFFVFPDVVMVGAVVSTTVTLVVASAYAPNWSITLKKYDVAGSFAGVSGCSASTLGSPPMYGPVRLPRNHAMAAMLLSGSPASASSANTARLGSLALHSNVCSGSSAAVGGWLTSLPLRLANISRWSVFNNMPCSEHTPPD